jgi:hypothetical protein
VAEGGGSERGAQKKTPIIIIIITKAGWEIESRSTVLADA